MNTHLELTPVDVDVLKRALSIRLTELRSELAHTDNRAYRSDLRQELDCLENIDNKISLANDSDAPTCKEVTIKEGDIALTGSLGLPTHTKGIVLFAHGSGSSRLSPRNQ